MLVQNQAFEASAGSGKTFMLVVRYLSLLFQGADPSKILTLTFTNKAAHEMQERIITTLKELPSRDELSVIATLCEQDKESILAQREQILEGFLSANLKIMTIDKFLTQILRKFSLHVGLMPDFTTTDAQHEIKLLNRFLKEVDVAGKKELLVNLAFESQKRFESIFELLNEFYLKQVECKGKRYGYTSPAKVEALILKEASELQRIVESSDKASSTARNSVAFEGLEDILKRKYLERETLDYSTFKKCFTPQMDRHLHSLQAYIKEYFSIKEQNFFYALTELVTLYERAKKALYTQESELGFDDVTLLVHYILREAIERDFLYFRLDAKIEHVLLDEFQDTSILQYEILKPIIEEILSGEGIKSGGSFFFVGDVKQSIYRFRGGVSSLFWHVAKENFTKVEALVTNYRSTQSVVDFVNQLFRTKIAGYKDQLVNNTKTKGYVFVNMQENLLEGALEHVQMLLKNAVSVNDIAILCATNGDGEMIKEYLEANHIEVLTQTNSMLIKQRSVMALIEYLKYLYFHEAIYKENFFALIDQEPQEIQRRDLSRTSLLGVLKQCIERFSLFDADMNLLKFLNEVSAHDVESLLFEYERLQTKAVSAELNGVRVLTIHKSKGLEYENVIVIDRLKNKKHDSKAIIYDYDGVSLDRLYLRQSNRESLDEDYKEAIEKERALSLIDSLNALYVAFTRAKERLFVVQKEKGSMFDILELSCGSYGELVFEQSTSKEEAKSGEKSPVGYRALYYGSQSEILELEKPKEEQSDAINFGIAMHYFLEMMSAFSQIHMPQATQMVRNRYAHLLHEEQIESLEQRIALLCQNEQFLELVDGVIYKERAIKVEQNLRYIDLLVRHKSGTWHIIDYKSSTNFSHEHQIQVKYYVDSIKKITGEMACGYIVYLLENEVKIVTIS